MEGQILPAFINLGAVGLMLWWLTFQLVPRLQSQQEAALNSFREELRLEREAHQETMQRVIEHCQEELKAILDARP